MKNLIIAVLVILLLLLAWLWYSEKNSIRQIESEMVQLNDSISHLSNTLKTMDEQREECKNKLDSIQTMMVKQEPSETGPARKPSLQENEIHAMILNLQADWEKAFTEKDPQKVISHFMPRYTTNQVIINTQNIPNVRKHDETNFEEHLKAILELGNISVDFGPVEFFYVFANDKIYTTSFKTSIIARYNYKVVNESKIICFVSGEKDNGVWKVGNYNWIRYEIMNTMK